MRGIPTEASFQRSCASMTIDLAAAAAHDPPCCAPPPSAASWCCYWSVISAAEPGHVWGDAPCRAIAAAGTSAIAVRGQTAVVTALNRAREPGCRAGAGEFGAGDGDLGQRGVRRRGCG